MTDRPHAPQAPPVPPMPPMPPMPTDGPAPVPTSAPAPASAAQQTSPARDARPQTREEYLASFPPVVYVPTTDESDPTHRRVILHTVEGDRTALFVYSAPDRLNEYYLPGNPWVLCDGAALQRVQSQTPFELLLLDVDPGLRDEEG